MAEFYRARWQIEPFFKRIEQHLEIGRDLYTFPRMPSVHHFERAPLARVLAGSDPTLDDTHVRNRLRLRVDRTVRLVSGEEGIMMEPAVPRPLAEVIEFAARFTDEYEDVMRELAER